MKRPFVLVLLIWSTISLYAQPNNPLIWANQVHAIPPGAGTQCLINEMEVASNGDYYIIGSFRGTMDIDPGPATTFISSTNTSFSDVLMAKYRSDGSFIWAKSFGAGNGDCNGYDIFLDDRNHLYITGNAQDTVDFDPSPAFYGINNAGRYSYFAEYDSSGALLQVHALNGQSKGLGICTDAQNNIYLAGDFRANVDFDPGPNSQVSFSTLLNSSYTWDAFYAKYSPNGGLLWHNTYGGTGVCYTSAIDAAPDGRILVGGSRYQINGGGGPFFRLLDAFGNILQSAYIPHGGIPDNGEASSVRFDSQHNMYIAGVFLNSADMDWGSGTQVRTTTGNTDPDAFLIKYDSLANFQWVITGSPANVYSSIRYEIEFDNNEDLLMAFLEGNGSTSNIGFQKRRASDGSVVWNNVLSTCQSFNSFPTIHFSPNDGNLLFTGGFGYFNTNTCTMDIDPGPGLVILPGHGGFRILMAKYGACTSAPGSPAAISGNGAVCLGDSQTYAIPPVNGANSYTWNLPSGWAGNSSGTSITVFPGSQSGTLSVTANNFCGSSMPQNISVTVSAGPALNISPASPAICEGESITLTASGGSSYVWNPGNLNGAQQTFSPTTSSAYQVIATDASGCSDSSTVNVTVNLPALAQIRDTICQGDSVLLAGAFQSQGGTYVDSLLTQSGCDSLVATQLFVEQVDTSVTSLSGTLTSGAIGAAYQWIDCNGNTPIVGANQASFTPTASGNYAVMLTQNGCNATSACFNVTVTSLADPLPFSISVQPNPSHAFFRVKGRAGMEISLYDLSGKLLHKTSAQRDQIEVETQQFSSGMYVLQIRWENQHTSMKLLID